MDLEGKYWKEKQTNKQTKQAKKKKDVKIIKEKLMKNKNLDLVNTGYWGKKVAPGYV